MKLSSDGANSQGGTGKWNSNGGTIRVHGTLKWNSNGGIVEVEQ